jgi:hypothetical protein
MIRSMFTHGTNVKRRFAAGALAALVLPFAPGPWLAQAHAGPLSQLQLNAQANTAKLRSAVQQIQQRVDLCIGIAHSASCRVAFESALRRTNEPEVKSRFYKSLGSRATVVEDTELAHPITLKFNEDPEWKRRAKVLAKDGLPFVRLPEGPNHQLLVGITPRGQFGVCLKDTTGE